MTTRILQTNSDHKYQQPNAGNDHVHLREHARVDSVMLLLITGKYRVVSAQHLDSRVLKHRSYRNH